MQLTREPHSGFTITCRQEHTKIDTYPILKEDKVYVMFSNFGNGTERKSDFRVVVTWDDVKLLVENFAAARQPEAWYIRWWMRERTTWNSLKKMIALFAGEKVDGHWFWSGNLMREWKAPVEAVKVHRWIETGPTHQDAADAISAMTMATALAAKEEAFA